MKMKKTWFSYLMWLVAAVFTGVLSAVYLSAYIKSKGGLNEFITVLVVCLAFAADVLLWFLFRKAAALLSEKHPWDSHLADMWECFIVMCLFAGAALYRIHALLHFTGTVENSVFYDMASVKAAEGIPQIAHGISYVYTALLSFLLSFTGNKVAAGIFLQLFIQLAALLVFFFAVRLFTGRKEAVCAMAFMAFSPLFHKEMFRISPESLHLLIYAAGLLLLGLYAGRAEAGQSKKSSYAIFALTGCYAGIAGYLDLLGITLLFFAGYICVKEAGKEGYKAYRAAGRFLCFLLPAAGAMAGLLFLDSLLSGSSFASVLQAWRETYMGGIGQIHFPAGADSELWAGIIICACAAFGVTGFWFHKEQEQDGFILLLLTVSVFDMTGLGQLRYGIFITAVWSVLAGIGIATVGTDREPALTEREPAGINDALRGAGKMTAADAAEAAGEEVIPHKDPGIGFVVEEISEEDQEVRFIENPLPLPKKHVKKEMDFDRDIKEAQLEFDFPAEENDDFDV